MNWGKSIILSFIVFAVFILTMVFRALNEDIFLVAPDYYEQEMKYQQHIDKLKNTQHIKGALEFTINRQTAQASIRFPQTQEGTLTGEIHFFRPSNARYDKKIPIQLEGDTREIFLDISQMPTGYWKVKINWKIQNTSYFEEKIMVL